VVLSVLEDARVSDNGKKHRLVSIGWLGSKTVYLDLTREEAIKRFQEDVGEDVTDMPIKEVEFDRYFYAYEVG
jgi:hypothetical protein